MKTLDTVKQYLVSEIKSYILSRLQEMFLPPEIIYFVGMLDLLLYVPT